MFYIKKIKLLTKNDVTSTLELEPHLNIIYGESNTGKSLILDCIDYLFGAKKHRFDQKLQLNEITLILDVDGKNLTLSRVIDSTDIVVSSSVPDIDSDTYKIGNAKKNINDVWLKLMGIDEPVKILMTVGGKPQRLTLRTFYHLLLIDETRIQGTGSILSQGTGPNPTIATSVLTSLLYLATGDNYLPDEDAQDPKIKKAKKEAVKSFVDRSMSKLTETKVKELENFSDESPEELQKKVDDAIDAIGSAEGALQKAAKRNHELADQIYSIDAQIAESKMLLNRNNSLLSQYAADIKRLAFIVEGDVIHDEVPQIDVCPFCNGKLTKEQGESCADAAVAEVDKIEAQIKDLRSVQQSIENEIKELIVNRKQAIDERQEVDTMIRGELRPQITQLRANLSKYTMALNQYKAKELIESFSAVLVKELEVSEDEKPEDFKFNVKGKFKEVFLASLDAELKSLLESCRYKNFTGVRFDLDDCDIVVNGHVKRSQGQGYRAFLNTLLSVAIQNCLESFNVYPAHLLIIDSPILSLKEKPDKDGQQLSDSMKSSLFKYFVENQGDRQTIIIENEIPKIDYGTAKLIEFTKDEDNGRYGLIEGYKD